MHSWKDVQQRLFLGHKQRTGTYWHTSRRVALLTSAVGRREATRSAEIAQLVNRVKDLLQELGLSPQLQGSQSVPEERIQKEGTCEPAPFNGSKSSLREAGEKDQRLPAKQETQAPVHELVPDLELLDIEEGFQSEDSWLVDIKNETEGQGSEEGVVHKEFRKARILTHLGSNAQEYGGAEESVDNSENKCRQTGEETQLHSEVGQNFSQVWTFARTAIIASLLEKSFGVLKDLQTACHELQKVRDKRAIRAASLIRRARELNGNEQSAAESVVMQVGAGEEELLSKILNSKEPELQEQTGSPGWLSVESLQSLVEKVRQLEASLAATCQEMEGRLKALWDELGEPLESRAVFEAQGKDLDVVARYQWLEQALQKAEKEVAMLQHIACLYQQRDDLRWQSQSQELLCRDASKQLLSRKADGASALRRAESDRKRLVRKSARIEERLDQTLTAWEAQTGKAFDHRLQSACMRLAQMPACLVESNGVISIEKGGTSGSCTNTRAILTSELVPVLIPLLENVV